MIFDAEAQQQLNEKLKEVERNNIEWFMARPSFASPFDDFDKLENHYTLSFGAEGISIKFIDDEVPQRIQEQAHNVVREFFKGV